MGKLLNIRAKNKLEINMRKNDTIAEITIYGAIGNSPWDDTISAKSFVKELKELPKSVSEIQLRINSPGGSVFDGVTIYERLKQHDAKIVAYVDGMAASIASVIMMAADEIIIGEAATVMIHKPLSGVYGNSEDMERMINILDKIEEQMISIYAKKTGKSRIELAKMLSDETWFTAEEAIEAKFADRTFDSGEGIAAAASMLKDASWIRHKPEMKAGNGNQEKIKELKNNLEGFLAR